MYFVVDHLKDTLQQATEVKKNMHLMGISFGEWVDKEELINTVSYPYEKNLFHVSTVEELATMTDEIRNHICNSMYTLGDFGWAP